MKDIRVTFEEHEALNDKFFTCRYGHLVIGFGRTEIEALASAQHAVADMKEKLSAIAVQWTATV